MIAGLSDKLIALRQAMNLSQHQAAARSGVSQSSIKEYENDESSPSIESLMKLAAFYSVSTDWLLGIEKTLQVDISDLEPQFQKHVIETVALYRDRSANT